MNRLITFIVFVLFITPLFGQNITSKFEDFNLDGYIDTLKCHYEGGSGFGGRYCTIINGKTKKIFELDNFGGFSNIKQSMLIQSELLSEKNEKFLAVFISELLPPKKETPDPSFQWIIESTKTLKKLKNNQYFDLIFAPQLQWNIGNFILPYNYYIELSGNNFNLLYNSNIDNYPKINEELSKGFVSYYGRNHFSERDNNNLVLIDSNKYYKIYSSNHGVLVKKGNKYKWVFISDFDLIEDLRPLRIKSIKDVKLLGQYLIVEINQYMLMYDIYFINIETGAVGKFIHSGFESSTTPESEMSEEENYINFDEYEDKFILLIKGKQQTIKYSELFIELEALLR